MLTEYKKTVEKTAGRQLDMLDAKIGKVHKCIMLAKQLGTDIDMPQDPSPGRAPHSDMKHHGKKRSPNARKRAQARTMLRFTESPSKFLGDISEM